VGEMDRTHRDERNALVVADPVSSHLTRNSAPTDLGLAWKVVGSLSDCRVDRDRVERRSHRRSSLLVSEIRAASPPERTRTMDLLVASINAVVVALVGAVVAWLARGRFEAIDRRFEALHHKIDRLETRLDGRIDTLQSSMDAMRSDLTQVALAVGVRPRAQND
jgi:hypothetical protein